MGALDSLAGQSFTSMSKTPLLDLATLTNSDGTPVLLDNIEGIAFGPQFGGKPTLILVSDNNFSAAQFTQFLAFSVTAPIPEASTSSMVAAGLMLLGFVAMRRRG